MQLFKEVRRHKPSVIYIPNVDVWYQTVGSAVIKTFTTLLKGLPPNDPILVLGILELSDAKDTADPSMLRDLFGFSLKNQYMIERPKEVSRAGSVLTEILTSFSGCKKGVLRERNRVHTKAPVGVS